MRINLCPKEQFAGFKQALTSRKIKLPIEPRSLLSTKNQCNDRSSKPVENKQHRRVNAIDYDIYDVPTYLRRGIELTSVPVEPAPKALVIEENTSSKTRPRVNTPATRCHISKDRLVEMMQTESGYELVRKMLADRPVLFESVKNQHINDHSSEGHIAFHGS